MKGAVIIVVGARGNGKSSFVKNHIRPVHSSRLFVYDVQGEYFEREPGEQLPDIEEFAQDVVKKEESVVVFEEATVFYSNRGSSITMRKLLVNARHSRNVIYLLFHSIRSIPHYIYDLSDYVIVFNTNDEEDLVESRHPLLLKAWKKVKGIKYKYEIVPL
jgi:predicted AAA+ superfamily ATPase